jgi:hypothetical protein
MKRLSYAAARTPAAFEGYATDCTPERGTKSTRLVQHRFASCEREVSKKVANTAAHFFNILSTDKADLNFN